MDEKELLRLLRALADESRIKILQRIEKGEICNCELTDIFPLRQSTISHHLKVLAEANLVVLRKQGKWTYYQLNRQTLEQIGPSLHQVLSDLVRY
ncbi:winged helix-turn-helix transcriptional regulator [Heliorestis acidaminivorans]|uniref:Winged helix-turn-helix transcriptional regulator n=1 Tax=Heliorestis acidaminivorans TaxID=553427 RepID=A0A6I0EZH8_9FIRM|nr:metalloregulator ArsR/SmtB family transcription factor [Heliorestis acidaminivorans]KAB2951031.1 winged helix-turn-helix transcriptional regulator [Heliorestis acidaminivorans]